MAEAVAEPQTAPVVEKQEATNGINDSSKEVSKNGAAVSDKKQSNGKRDREEDEDDYERYDHGKSDKREKRDRDDRRGRDGDRKGGGRGWARGGGRGRGGRGGGGRGGGRGGFDRDNRNYRKDNVRTKYERQEESNDAAEIRRQVEFYFSSSNLPVDRFLLEETGGPENKWFSLKTLHNFKRMRHFQPYSAVVEAVKGSDLVEINDKDEIRRKVPIDSKFTLDVKKNNEILTTETMKRSIYAKGFGEEHSKTAFEVEEFFNPYGAKAVRLRRAEDGTFKGSAFIEFGSEDDAQQFLDMEDKPKFNEKELNIMGKKAYVDMKSQGILDGTVKPKSPTRQGDFRRGNNRRGDHGHGNRKPRRNSFDYGDNKRKRDKDDDDVEDKDDWRSRRDKFQKKRDGSVTRSRSRSPYHAEKSDEKPVEEKKAKPAAESEEKPADKGEEKPAEKDEGKLAEKSEDKPVEKTETVDPPAAENVAEASEVNTNA